MKPKEGSNPVRRDLLVLLPTAVVGVVAGVVALFAHQGDTGLIAAQQAAQRGASLQPVQLESILQNTREPVPTGHGAKALAVSCHVGTKGPKLNPWRCAIHYRSGAVIEYRLEVSPDGSFSGSDRTGVRLIHGCCVLGVARQRRRPT